MKTQWRNMLGLTFIEFKSTREEERYRKAFKRYLKRKAKLYGFKPLQIKATPFSE
jgi:hypothetical protein